MSSFNFISTANSLEEKRCFRIPSKKLLYVELIDVFLSHSLTVYTNTVKLHKVVEVREGQLTESFNKFPYDEVEKQSLSLIFEQESEFSFS